MDLSPAALLLVAAAAFGSAILGGLFGLALLSGSWAASTMVSRIGQQMHIAIIEVLIAVSGVSIVMYGIRAL